jgi:hypothetical protein
METLEPADFKRYMAFLQTLDADAVAGLKDWLSPFDLVVPRCIRLVEGSLRNQYARFHPVEDYDALSQVLPRMARFSAIASGHGLPELPDLYPCCLYIMRTALFDDYMRYWHEAVQALEQVLPARRDPYQSRAIAFLSERIFTFYLYYLRIEQPRLRIAELPYLFTDIGRL